ncbi:MAG: PAS domain S-box protein [Candidatus Sabulitectum sp.]|nr:PAS domain S-box protein [Candidatus Sabulitectum sp.]
MYDNAPLSYQSLDCDGCFLDVNPTWLKTLGYLREEVIRKNFADFLPPESKKHFKINFPAFKKRGFVHDVQFRIRHKDGHYLDISFEGCVGYNDDKSFKQTYCVFQDITEKVLTEKAYRKSQDLLRNIFESSTNLYYSHTPDHVFTYMSPQVEEMLGYTPEEIKVMWMKLASDNPINEIGFENTVRAIETGERQPPYELELVRKDGKNIWVEVRVFPEVVNGKTIAMLGSLTEITQRKRTEEELKRSEERFRLLYENSPDMYVSVSASDGSILRCNKTLLNKTGYLRNEVIGSNIFDMYHADALNGAHEAFDQYVSTGRVTDNELILKRKNGSKLQVSLNVSAVRDEAGKILHSISSWRDISQRKQAEESVRESEEKFRTIFDNKGTATGLFNKDGTILDCNAVFCELSKYSREEIMGKIKWSDFVVAEDLERLQKYHAERSKKDSSSPASTNVD